MPPSSAANAGAGSWSPLARRIASVLLVLHIAAVFIAPFAFACTTPAGSSPFADGLMWLWRPYIDALYLNHGYAFFAPDPGPSHLVRYRVEFDDGRAPMEESFPNLQSQRPRLLYHRHFMLAEQLHNLYTPGEPPPDLPLSPATSRQLTEPQRRALTESFRQEHRRRLAAWTHSREVYLSFRQSLERHLVTRYGANRVTLSRVEHGQLSPPEFQVLRRLDAPHTYVNLPESSPAPEVLRPEGTTPP